MIQTFKAFQVAACVAAFSSVPLMAAAPKAATQVTAQPTVTATTKAGGIEINGMTPQADCEDLDIVYSQSENSRRGEVYVEFNDPFKVTSGDVDGGVNKKHCLVDFDIYVPEGIQFGLRNAALLGHVDTGDNSYAKVATSYRPIGKAGAVATRTFGPGEDREFYVESPRTTALTSQDARCGGMSMILRLRVDLSLDDDGKVRVQPEQHKAAVIKLATAALRYVARPCAPSN